MKTNSLVSGCLEVGGEGPGLVGLGPGDGAAVVIVGEHMMVVDIQTSQH